MTANDPCLLDIAALSRRLRELAGDERNIQVEFLLHLDVFDGKDGHLEAGYGSLWDFCLRALHLREGAAGRRIAAMRALRRFPVLEAPLRDGRLCLSTVALLAPVLTEGNVNEIVARAAYKTKAEVDHLVASLHPRVAPKDGIRKVPESRDDVRAAAAPAPSPRVPAPAAVTGTPPEASAFDSGAATVPVAEPLASVPMPCERRDDPLPPAPGGATRAGTPRHASRGVDLRAVSGSEWSLRVTIGPELKADLETLSALLSHTSGADLAAVLHEAVRCGIEKHGRRKGAVAPTRTRASARREPTSAPDPRAIPAAVRREVWKRDGGCCTWTGIDGRRCTSRWKIEIDHVVPAARGGAPIAANLRLLCASHNAYHAEQTYGREHMARFTRVGGGGKVAEHPNEVAPDVPRAREPALEWGPERAA